jgi:hypothetical protein
VVGGPNARAIGAEGAASKATSARLAASLNASSAHKDDLARDRGMNLGPVRVDHPIVTAPGHIINNDFHKRR